MKKLLLFALVLPLFALAFVAAPKNSNPPVKKIHWYTWEEMAAANAKNPKPIFVDVYTQWCGWCKKMDRSTFQDPKVIKTLTNDFYAVKLDAEQKKTILFKGTEFKFVGGRRGHNELAASLLDGQLSFPTTVLLTSNYERIMLSPGFKKVKGLMQELNFVTSGEYLEEED